MEILVKSYKLATVFPRFLHRIGNVRQLPAYFARQEILAEKLDGLQFD